MGSLENDSLAEINGLFIGISVSIVLCTLAVAFTSFVALTQAQSVASNNVLPVGPIFEKGETWSNPVLTADTANVPRGTVMSKEELPISSSTDAQVFAHVCDDKCPDDMADGHPSAAHKLESGSDTKTPVPRSN